MEEKSQAEYIKLIHTLKSKGGITDPEYRTILRDVAGVSSSKDLNPAILFGKGMKVLPMTGSMPDCWRCFTTSSTRQTHIQGNCCGWILSCKNFFRKMTGSSPPPMQNLPNPD